jgi:hypothetical protein
MAPKPVRTDGLTRPRPSLSFASWRGDGLASPPTHVHRNGCRALAKSGTLWRAASGTPFGRLRIAPSDVKAARTKSLAHRSRLAHSGTTRKSEFAMTNVNLSKWLLVACALGIGCGGRADLLSFRDGGGGANSGDVGSSLGNLAPPAGTGSGTLAGGTPGTPVGGSAGTPPAGSSSPGAPAPAGGSSSPGTPAPAGGGGSPGTPAGGSSGTVVASGPFVSGSYAGGAGYGGMGGTTGTPPACNFPLPNVCEYCSSGEVVCAHYAIRAGKCVPEICPPSSPAGCSPGAMCAPGTGCASASGPGSNSSCSTSCQCDATGHLECAVSCPPPPLPPPSMCAQGSPCSPSTGCASAMPYPGPYPGGACSISCSCDPTGHYQCTRNCPPPCSGPLPLGPCQQCSDGTYACPRYVGIGGKCVIETCPPGQPACAPGATCIPNSGCGTVPVGGCFETCWCDVSGHYICNAGCAGDAGGPLDAAPIPGPPPVPPLPL